MRLVRDILKSGRLVVATPEATVQDAVLQMTEAACGSVSSVKGSDWSASSPSAT